MNLNDTFLARTDALATNLRVNVEDLTEILGISRSSLFGWRRGGRPVSNKGWAKLEAAEKEAGMRIAPAVADDQQALRSQVSEWRLAIHNFWIEGAGAGVVLGQAADELTGDLGAEAERMSARVRETSTPAIEALRGLCDVVAELMGEEPAQPNPVVYDMTPRRDQMVAEDDPMRP